MVLANLLNNQPTNRMHFWKFDLTSTWSGLKNTSNLYGQLMIDVWFESIKALLWFASHNKAFMDSNHTSIISWPYKFCLFFRLPRVFIPKGLLCIIQNSNNPNHHKCHWQSCEISIYQNDCKNLHCVILLFHEWAIFNHLW